VNVLLGLMFIVAALPVGIMGYREWDRDRRDRVNVPARPSHHLRIVEESSPRLIDWKEVQGPWTDPAS
jgi:hypothetical protein